MSQRVKKNYQIELCKECWEINYSKDAIECFYFSKNIPNSFTKLTASIADPKNKYSKEPLIDYDNNTCRFFKSKKSMKGGRRRGINPRCTVSGRDGLDRDAKKSWKGGWYTGQS